MIEVVKETVRCGKCGRMLAYNIEDVQPKVETYGTDLDYITESETIHYIECPICGFHKRVKKY